MRNVLNKSCTENQNTHFMFNNSFPKIAPFITCRKIWCRPRGHKWRHNMAHTRCVLDYQGYMHVCASTCPRVRVTARTHASAHACTHWPRSNTYCFSTATVIRERASVWRYTYIACLVTCYSKSCIRRTSQPASYISTTVHQAICNTVCMAYEMWVELPCAMRR
jgi:hypothetical protein